MKKYFFSCCCMLFLTVAFPKPLALKPLGSDFMPTSITYKSVLLASTIGLLLSIGLFFENKGIAPMSLQSKARNVKAILQVVGACAGVGCISGYSFDLYKNNRDMHRILKPKLLLLSLGFLGGLFTYLFCLLKVYKQEGLKNRGLRLGAIFYALLGTMGCYFLGMIKNIYNSYSQPLIKKYTKHYEALSRNEILQFLTTLTICHPEWTFSEWISFWNSPDALKSIDEYATNYTIQNGTNYTKDLCVLVKKIDLLKQELLLLYGSKEFSKEEYPYLHTIEQWITVIEFQLSQMAFKTNF